MQQIAAYASRDQQEHPMIKKLGHKDVNPVDSRRPKRIAMVI